MNRRSASRVWPPSGIAPLAQHSRCRCPFTRPGVITPSGASMSRRAAYRVSRSARWPTSTMTPASMATAPARYISRSGFMVSSQPPATTVSTVTGPAARLASTDRPGVVVTACGVGHAASQMRSQI